MEHLRKDNSKLFTLLDRVATTQHNQLLTSLLAQLESYSTKKPELLLLPNAFDRVKDHSEAAISP